MKNAILLSPGRFHSPQRPVGKEVIRQIAAVRDVTHLVTAMISRLEHGEEVDIRAALRRSTAARENANRFIDATMLRLGRAVNSGVAEEAAGAKGIRRMRTRCKAVEDRES